MRIRVQSAVPAALLAAAFGLSACGGGISVGNGISVNIGAPAFQAEALAQFDSMKTAFGQNYVYFTAKNIDWDALTRDYRPRAALAADQNALNALLVELLGKLHDAHVHIEATDGTQLATYAPARFMNWDGALLQKYIGRMTEPYNPQHDLGVARVPGGSYMAIASWNNTVMTVADLDALMEKVKDSPALILDIRMNPGGNDTLARALAGRFTTATRLMDYTQTRNGPGYGDLGPLQERTVDPRGAWQFTRPVILLTGRGTASSSESFVSFMRTLPNVTVAGDTTAGASGNPGPFRLNDKWSVTVSRTAYYTTDRQLIEDKGMTPAVPVPATAADFAAGRDPVLDWALAQVVALK